jgi:glutamate synthase domain-containing protein 2/CDGSH-type Zn-finger protein
MADPSPPRQPVLRCAKNGPYVVEGLTTLTGFDGAALGTRKAITLCRCGRSNRKPFCDGTHAKVGFEDAVKPDRVRDKRDAYAGRRILIFDNRGICSHAGHCTDNLKSVFRAGVEPWIDPDGAELERVIEVIRLCPSGALSYAVDGVEHRDQDRPPAIRVTLHGPYRLQGGVELSGVGDLDGASREHRTLCRCGHSKNKPFCDGSHWHADFRDDGRYRVGMLGSLHENEWDRVDVHGVAVEVRRNGESALARMAESRKALAVTVEPRWGEVLVELAEVMAAGRAPRAISRRADAPASEGTREEPYVGLIRRLATEGLETIGTHGIMGAMGVPRYALPGWDDLQIVTAQLHVLPQMEDVPVGTDLVVGPRATRPLRLDIPLIVSDMSFGSLSLPAKVALAKGAELAGTGICSGEGGMLPEEQQANSRYFYELASARFGFSFDLLTKVQAFHFKGGQAAKTGTGGHLPANKVTERIAGVRGLKAGEAAVSPPTFPGWKGVGDFRDFAAEVRGRTGGIPVGFKLSAQHIEKDIDAALAVGVDYVIVDGRGGGTGAAPIIFRDNISVPTMPASARARRQLDASGASHVTLFITGGLRTAADFAKALALGGDGIAIANAAIQAIGCLGSRVCHTNTCPSGIATQDPALSSLIDVETEARNLERFLRSVVHLMQTLARACGHTHLQQFCIDDLTTWKRDVAHLTGVRYGGVTPLESGRA